MSEPISLLADILWSLALRSTVMAAIASIIFLGVFVLVLRMALRAFATARTLSIRIESGPHRAEIIISKNDSVGTTESHRQLSADVIEGSVIERRAIADATSVSVDLDLAAKPRAIVMKPR